MPTESGFNQEEITPAGAVDAQPQEVRSAHMEEIISRQPGFLERWALWIFLLLLLLMLTGTWFIRYPDVLQGNAILTAANAPKEIVVRQDGKVIRLFAGNDEQVDQGQMIGWIESTASHAEVLALSRLLDSGVVLLNRNKTELVSHLFQKGYQDLGELQPAYQQFITAWQQFSDYLVNGYYSRKKLALFKDQLFLTKMHQTIEQQAALAKQDLQLTQEGYDANNSLYDDKVISKQDLRDQKSKLVGKQQSLPQLQSSLLANENEQVAKQKEIDELEHTISLQKTIFEQSLQTLLSLVNEWKRKYVITAPTEGRVVFIMPLQENQFLQAGKVVGYVNPADTRYYAQVTLQQGNFGKVAVGQRVQLRFNAYPYQEFGYVEGRLSYISKVPSDSGFLASIALPNGLVTNYRRPIQYRNGLSSQALIITRDARLFQRFYYSIVKGVQR